jgi:DNA repair exonuclease SbcCD ATPase subunit
MGLFSRKPKSIIVQQATNRAVTETEAMDRLEHLLPKVEVVPPLAPPPKIDPAPRAAQPPTPPKPAKRNKKGFVDPADFLALRAELIDMRARLDESEQSRAMVEARLSSLDAAASAFSTERNDISEITEMVTLLQQQVAEHSTANGSGAEAAPPPPTPGGPDPETLERIAAVQQRVNDLDQIRHRLGEIDHLKQRMGEIDHLHQRVSGVEVLHQRMGELDRVEQRLAGVDGLAMQLQQLNARVAAQAELGGQLSALRDRVAQITEQPHGADDDIRLQLQEIGERLRSNDELRTQIDQLSERSTSNDAEARAVREHMALLDQRLTNVSTELANQLGELGRDIDGLGQRIPEVADGVVSDEVVDALRGGQVKLANEQARYEIAFREDLAALAEQLRRGHDDDS